MSAAHGVQLATFKQRVRQLTRRSGGRGMVEAVERLRPCLMGWKAYFGRAQTPGIWRSLDEWSRPSAPGDSTQALEARRDPVPRTAELGGSCPGSAEGAANSRCGWRNSKGDIKRVLAIAYFDRLGVPRLS